MKQHCYFMQESRSARTDNNQYTLHTEDEKTTIHQEAKDTRINCSPHRSTDCASNTHPEGECTTNTMERQAQASINSDMTKK